MSEERRKTNKSSTGTVPKIKHRNNTLSGTLNDERSRGVTNNLAGYWQHSAYPSHFIQNQRRNHRKNYFPMDAAVEESNLTSIQNGSNYNTNASSSSPRTSSSTSRRNSSNSALKCDNVTKYPDKKQIEDKLHQIQEYLKITNSLMTNMKNTEEAIDESEIAGVEKMIKDLQDSEQKLIAILQQINAHEAAENKEIQIVENGMDSLSEHSSSSHRKNDLDINLDNPSNEIESLKEQQIALMQLQHKAEKKLKDARQMQSNFLNAQYASDHGNSSNFKDSNSYNHIDKAIKELEECSKRRRPAQINQQIIQDNILSKVDSLQNQIMSLRDANEEREQLIQALDNQDADLRSQHAELQSKLVELQSKKMQVDELVVQLQSFGEEEDEDIGLQVRKIVTMKDQLKKLKDMLEIVKTTENIMQNSNSSQEVQAAAFDICAAAENYLEKESQKQPPKHKPVELNESNLLRYDNDTSSDSIPKQVNKNIRKQGSRVANAKTPSSISQKLALQAELEAKRRELEEIMGKHKASTSNLNHDIGIDNKSEFSCTGNSVNEAWLPLGLPQHQDDSDRFSSDEGQEEVNDYSEINDNLNVLTLTNSNYSPSNASKTRTENVACPEYAQHPEYDRSHGLSHTPERNIRSSSVTTTSCIREQPRSNTDQEIRTQVQKQLQLIKNVCDSMLEQQLNYSTSNPNVQHLRNNLTPSPLYSEPRRYATPNPTSMNTMNVTNPNPDVPWFPFNNAPNNLNNDMSNYNGWLATNTIQTQSFMLNTLNQCCQMLWLQQRELVSLRNTVSVLQERIEGQYPLSQDHLSSLQNNPQDRSNQYRPTQKPNHVSAAFSLPNLNQYNTGPPSNLDPNYINHNNSIQSGRMLDPCLNNLNINHPNVTQTSETANNVLHGVNANINPSHMWNGQALNNQVAPGNRANNYWDNFRSYSRQNLLSTKNSDPHTSLDRPNTSSERTNPFTLMTFSKSNSEQDSASTSQENTPQRRSLFRHENIIPPPDVLNVNHNVTKGSDHLNVSAVGGHHDSNEDINLGFQMLLNLNAYNDNSSNHSNISEEHIFKECIPEQCRRRNEWNDEVEQEHVSEEQLPKSKLFEELRENVYKEVVSLISANESRPHFLIQLFRDLQMIGSDSLRLKILQSIQMIITHSLLHSNNSTRLSLGSQLASSEQDVSQISDNFSLPTVWSKPSNFPKDFTEFQNVFKGAVPFLNDHEDEIIQNPLLVSLKQVLLGSGSFKDAIKDTVFHKHLSNILDEIFEQYRGKKVRDVKVPLLQTLNDLLCGELGFIQIIQETNLEKINSRLSNEVGHDPVNFPVSSNYDNSKIATNSSQVLDNIQNGDLAEADQTRVIDEDVEDEEGAVGGILDSSSTTGSTLLNQTQRDELDMSLEEPCEGLDQIPTRLPTKSKSRSTTPNRDRSNSRADPEPF